LNGRGLVGENAARSSSASQNRLAPRERQGVQFEMTGAIHRRDEIRRLWCSRQRFAKFGIVQTIAMRDQDGLILLAGRSGCRESCDSIFRNCASPAPSAEMFCQAFLRQKVTGKILCRELARTKLARAVLSHAARASATAEASTRGMPQSRMPESSRTASVPGGSRHRRFAPEIKRLR